MSSRRKKASAIAAALLLALCAIDSGCGGGSDETGTAPLPPTKSQFAEQANAICHKGILEKERGLQSVFEETKEGLLERSPSAQAKMVSEIVVPAYEQLVKQLAQLTPPPQEEVSVDKIVNGFEKAIRNAEADPAKAIEENPFAAANEAAKDYGLERCIL